MKVLLVGDLRNAYNYGAVATTNALIDLIYKANKDIELKTIDYRSLNNETPVKGWDDKTMIKKINNCSKIKKILRPFFLKLGLLNIVKKLKNKKTLDFIPPRFDLYAQKCKEIEDGGYWLYESELIKWSDIVIINGEGNIVNGTDEKGYYRRGGRYILFFAYVAKKIFDKPCYIINHTVDPKNRDIDAILKNVYPLLDGVYLREQLSVNFLNKLGVTNHRYIPDALWSHDFENDSAQKLPLILKNFDFSKPYICLGDSSGIKNRYNKVKWDVIKTYNSLITQLKQICPQIVFVDGYRGGNPEINEVIRQNDLPAVNLDNCNCAELFYVLKHSQLFVSGRWHASIIASLAHTPIILFGSDSHKTEALYSELVYPYEFFDVGTLPLNVDRIANEAKKIMSADNSQIWKNVDNLKTLSFENTNMLRNKHNFE